MIFLAVLLLQITHAAQDNSSIVIAVRMLNGVGMTASDAEPDAEPESEPNAECHALTELQKKEGLQPKMGQTSLHALWGPVTL